MLETAASQQPTVLMENEIENSEEISEMHRQLGCEHWHSGSTKARTHAIDKRVNRTAERREKNRFQIQRFAPLDCHISFCIHLTMKRQRGRVRWLKKMISTLKLFTKVSFCSL